MANNNANNAKHEQDAALDAAQYAAQEGAQDAAGALERWQAHCDGDDPFFMRELQDAPLLGLGETWDASLCDQGLRVKSNMTTGDLPDFGLMPKVILPLPTSRFETRFYSSVVPVVSFGSLFVAVIIAAILYLLSRRKEPLAGQATCTACQAKYTLVRGDPLLRNQFCPACGGVLSIHLHQKMKVQKA